MKHVRSLIVAAAVAVVVSLSGAAFAQVTVEEFTKDWPQSSRDAAKAMVAKYGKPTGVSPAQLLWANAGTWHHVIVYKEEARHNFPMPHADVLEQAVAYKVPVDKIDDLAAFDGSVIVDRTKGVLAARCDAEASNILALNLAHEIVTGAKTVDQARADYARIAAKAKQGGMDDYTDGLQFAPVNIAQAGDPDQPFSGTGQATTGTGTTGMGTEEGDDTDAESESDTTDTARPDTLER